MSHPASSPWWSEVVDWLRGCFDTLPPLEELAILTAASAGRHNEAFIEQAIARVLRARPSDMSGLVRAVVNIGQPYIEDVIQEVLVQACCSSELYGLTTLPSPDEMA